MHPYATFFNILRYAHITRLDGVWQDWLCMRIDSKNPEPWEICLAENPIVFDDAFASRIETERAEFLSVGNADVHTLSAGFCYKMFIEGRLDYDDINYAVGCFNEETGLFLYDYCFHTQLYDKAGDYLEKTLSEPSRIFSRLVWNNLPQEFTELIYSYLA